MYAVELLIFKDSNTGSTCLVIMTLHYLRFKDLSDSTIVIILVENELIFWVVYRTKNVSQHIRQTESFFHSPFNHLSKISSLLSDEHMALTLAISIEIMRNV